MLIRFLLYYYYFRCLYSFPSRAKLLHWQERKKTKLLAILLERSPYYQKRGVKNISLLERESYLEHFDELNTLGFKKADVLAFCEAGERIGQLHRDYRGETVGLSSGTGHQRGIFIVAKSERVRYSAHFISKVLPRSIFSRHRIAYFLRADNPLYSTSQSRRVRFQYFDLKTEMAEHIKNLHAFQPTSLFAPASMLLKIAKAIRTGELKLTALERVLTGAEALDPVDAANLREVFKEPIMNIYQCTEGFLAVGCSLGSIHLNEDMLIIEKDYLDAEKKRFCPIITDLRRITQPYVRYRMNDVLLESSEACACGSVLQKIESITGRENDLIRLDGTQILFHDEISTIFLKHRSLFSEYQLVQTGANELSLSLRDEKPTAREKIESDLRALIASKKYSAVEIKNVSYQAPLPWIKLRRIRNEFTVPLNVVG